MKALQEFDQYLDAGLRKSIVIPSEVASFPNGDGREKSKSKQAAATSMRDAIVVKARLIKMEPGSAAARYWAIGSGAAKASIEGEVIDGATGKALFAFKQTRAGFFSPSGGYDAILAKISQELGEDIGKGIAAFCPKETKRCKQD